MSWRNAPLAGSTVDRDKEKEERGILGGLEDFGRDMQRQAGLATRNVITGLTGVPGIFADAAAAGYNLATGSNMQMPTAATQALMTRMGLPEPEGTLENVLGTVQSAMAGGAVKMPTIGPQAPAGFTPRPSLSQQTFEAGRQEGYVVPPATVRPGVRTRLLEGISGKAATQQEASLRNQEVTNRLAAQAIGLSPNEPITLAALKSIRDDAGKVYAGIRQAGRITTDPQYKQDLARIGQTIADISDEFQGANVGARDDIFDLIKTLNKDNFGSNAAVSYLNQLREDAANNLAAEGARSRALGMAQKRAAEALENAILRHLRATGKEGLADSFGAARTLIAKTYDVQSATNLQTGNVRAKELAKMLANEEPLSGELRTIGRFGATFPKATEEITSSPAVSAADIYGSLLGTGALFSAGGGALSPVALGMPLARMGVRSGILSETGQNVLTRPYQGVPGRAFTAGAGLLGGESEEERRRRRGR